MKRYLLLSALFLACAAHAQEKFKVSTVTFSRPAGWESLPAAGMRAAELRLVDAKTKDEAEMAFFHFGPANGGGTEANVKRWFGLFVEKDAALKQKVDTLKAGKTAVTYVQAEGTYMKGPPLGDKTPMRGWILLGAIVEAEGGHIFIRMTGPSALVTARTPEFKKMVEGALK